MTSRNLLNVFLALALAGLVALVVYEPGKERPPEAKPITQLKPDSVQQLEIESSGRPRIVLKKHGDQWRMESPFLARANAGRIHQLLAIAQAKSVASYPMSRVDANQLQLDSPILQLTLDDMLLRIGTTTALGDNRYVQVGNMVHLITDRYTHLARGVAGEFVSPALLSPETRVSELRLATGNVSGRDEREQSLLNEWRHARAERVSVLQKSDVEMESVMLILAEGERLQFDVLRTEDEVILQQVASGLQYHFAQQAGERLLTVPSARPDSLSDVAE